MNKIKKVYNYMMVPWRLSRALYQLYKEVENEQSKNSKSIH